MQNVEANPVLDHMVIVCLGTTTDRLALDSPVLLRRMISCRVCDMMNSSCHEFELPESVAVCRYIRPPRPVQVTKHLQHYSSGSGSGSNSGDGVACIDRADGIDKAHVLTGRMY